MREESIVLYVVGIVAFLGIVGMIYASSTTSLAANNIGMAIGAVTDGLQYSSTDSNLDALDVTSETYTDSASKKNRLIIREDGDYYVKMEWFNAAANVDLYLFNHTIKLGSFYGYYPPMPSEIYLGHFTVGRELIFNHNTAWRAGTYGPFYSNSPGLNTRQGYYGIKYNFDNSWTLKFNDGTGYSPGTMHGQFKVYKKASVCTDTDANSQYPDGKNYYLKGTVTFEDDTGEDHCYDSNTVMELFCTLDKGGSGEKYTCPNGCDDGACKSTPISIDFSKYLIVTTIGNFVNRTPSLIESTEYGFKHSAYNIEYYDSTNDITARATVAVFSSSSEAQSFLKVALADISNKGSYTILEHNGRKYVSANVDNDNDTLLVWISENFVIVIGENRPFTNFPVIFGSYYARYIAEDVYSTCTDTDGGKYYYVKGFTTVDGSFYNDKCVTPISGSSVYVSYNGQGYHYNNFDNDSCSGNACYIAEAYCDKATLPAYREFFIVNDCPNGCRLGACINSTTNSGVQFHSVNVYPQDFVVIGAYNADYIYADVSVINNFPSTVGAVYITLSIPALHLSEVKTVTGLSSGYSYSTEQFNINLPLALTSGTYDIFVTMNYDYGGRSYNASQKFVRHFAKLADVTCSKSDNGNIYTKGTVTETFPDGFVVSINDSCCTNCLNAPSPTGPSVSEYYCDGNFFKRGWQTCQNGCINGACIQNSTAISLILKDYPKYFFNDIKDFTGVIVVGARATPVNVLSGVDIAASLQRYSNKTGNVGVGWAKLDTEITQNDWDSKGFIVIGGICSNSITEKVYDNPTNCAEGYVEGVGRIDFIVTDYDKPVIIVHGYSDEDLKRATKVLANWKDYNLENITANTNSLCVTGELTNSLTVYACAPLVTVQQSTETLKDFPQPFLNKGGQPDTMFVVGRRAAVDDVMGITDIVASMQRYAGNNPFPPGIVIFDDQISNDDYNTNMIVVGGICANLVAASIYGNPVECTVQDTPGVGKIHLVKTGSSYKLLVHGYDAKDTTMATRVLANWNKYNDVFKDASEVCVSGSLSDMNVYKC
jgi:hypothetical protein